MKLPRFTLFSQINFIFPVMFLCDNHSYHSSLSPFLLSPSSSLWNCCSKNFVTPKVQKFLAAAIYLAPYLTNLTVPEIFASERIHSREYHRAKGIIVPFQGTECFGLGWAIEDNTGAATAKKKTLIPYVFITVFCLLLTMSSVKKQNFNKIKKGKGNKVSISFPPKAQKNQFKIWNRTSFDSLGV